MPLPSAALSGVGCVPGSKKAFFSPGPGWLPARTGCSADAGTLRCAQLCSMTTSMPEHVQAEAPWHPALPPEHHPGVLPSPISKPPSSSLQLQTHIQGARLSHLDQCQCFKASPGSYLLELSPHRGYQAHVPTGDAAPPVTLRVLV